MLYRHLLLKDKINGIVWKVRIASGELILDSTTYINAMSDFVFQDKTNPSVYWKLIIENGELLIEETAIQQDDIVGLKDGNNYWKFIVEDGELYYITVTEGEVVSPGGVGRSLNRVIFEEPTELIIEVKGIKLVKVEKLFNVKFVLLLRFLFSKLVKGVRKFKIKALAGVKVNYIKKSIETFTTAVGLKKENFSSCFVVGGSLVKNVAERKVLGTKIILNKTLINSFIIGTKLKTKEKRYFVKGNKDFSSLIYALSEI